MLASRAMAPARGRRPRVEIREGAHGRRVLLVDGTLASARRRDGPSAGPIWDAMAAPLLALPPRERRRVLVLGLGAGSSARLLRALAPGAEIVGVELDGAVVDAARAHFDLDALGVECHVDDALAFLRRDRRTYDMVIDDVFIGRVKDVRKPDWLPRPGLALARRRLRPGGILVSNTIHEGPAVARELSRLLPHAVSIGVRQYWNRIMAAGHPDLEPRRLRRALASEPAFARSLPWWSLRRLSGGMAG